MLMIVGGSLPTAIASPSWISLGANVRHVHYGKRPSLFGNSGDINPGNGF
jgi:hypothetical protein